MSIRLGMSQRANTLTLLLPERRRFAGQPIAKNIAKTLAQADRLTVAEEGECAQLQHYFKLSPPGWPMAAITRQYDAGDALPHAWLRADPVYIRPEMSGARLMAWGNLGLSQAEADDFLKPLKRLFDKAGFPLSATAPERWYLQLPANLKLPDFSSPVEGLGENLLLHLPQGSEGQRWRTLLNEAQIILHNHPRNIERLATGLLPINSLWFWGDGRLPDKTNCLITSVISNDPELLALAQLAGIPAATVWSGHVVIDLRHERDWAAVEQRHLEDGMSGLGWRCNAIVLHFADGQLWCVEPGQRWRFWRRALTALTPIPKHIHSVRGGPVEP